MRILPFYIPEDAPPAKRAILQAALALFAERGLDGTSIRDIAERTGFTNPALYRHFPTKLDLALYLFEICYRRTVERVQRAFADSQPPRALARAYVEANVRCFAECPQASLFVNDHLRVLWPKTHQKLPGPTMVTQARHVVEALREKRGPAAKLPVGVAVATILGGMGQCARFYFFGELEGPPETWIEPLTTMVVRVGE